MMTYVEELKEKYDFFKKLIDEDPTFGSFDHIVLGFKAKSLQSLISKLEKLSSEDLIREHSKSILEDLTETLEKASSWWEKDPTYENKHKSELSVFLHSLKF